ncbi:MAG: hypothetical protein AAGA99_09830 [Actinomycetota bacterium]
MTLFTSAAKHALALVTLAFVGLIVYAAGDIVVGGANDPGEVQGVIYDSIFVWQAGDLFGVLVFLGLFAAGSLLAWVVFAARDPQGLPAETDVEVPLSSPAYWPLVLALGVGLAIVGLVVNTQLAVLGFIVMGIGVLEWVVTAWTDRHSPSPERNRTLRNRLMLPLEIPAFTGLLMAIPVVMMSRIFLAVSKTGAALIATGVSLVLITVFFVIYAKPDIGKGLLAGASVLGVVALIVSGIVSAAIGQRDIEVHFGDEHEEEHSDEEAEEESLGAIVVLADSGAA